MKPVATRTRSTDTSRIAINTHIVTVAHATCRHLHLAPAVRCVEVAATDAEAALADGVDVSADVAVETRREERDETHAELRLEEEAALTRADAVAADRMRAHTTAALQTRTLHEPPRQAPALERVVSLHAPALTAFADGLLVSTHVIARAPGSDAERRRALTGLRVETIETATDSLHACGVAVGAADTGNTHRVDRSGFAAQCADSLVQRETARALARSVDALCVDVTTNVTSVARKAEGNTWCAGAQLLEVIVTAETQAATAHCVAVTTSLATRCRQRRNQTRCVEFPS